MRNQIWTCTKCGTSRRYGFGTPEPDRQSALLVCANGCTGKTHVQKVSTIMHISEIAKPGRKTQQEIISVSVKFERLPKPLPVERITHTLHVYNSSVWLTKLSSNLAEVL